MTLQPGILLTEWVGYSNTLVLAIIPSEPELFFLPGEQTGQSLGLVEPSIYFTDFDLFCQVGNSLL
jgi:hypothetical protein